MIAFIQRKQLRILQINKSPYIHFPHKTLSLLNDFNAFFSSGCQNQVAPFVFHQIHPPRNTKQPCGIYPLDF